MKPTEPLIRQFEDLKAVSGAAAEQFCRIARDAISARAQCTIVLAGGSTPHRLYEVLATPAYQTEVQWDRAEFFWGDERMVPSEHPDSNFQMANKALLSRIPVPQRNIHRIPTERGEPETVARKYEEEIAEVFRVRAGGQPPAFDLILLGMGTDGHTASLFPNTDALNEASRWVAPNRGPLPHVDRVTMTARILNAARHVVFLVVGADKADILAQVLEGPRDPRRLPSQMICPASGDVMWFVDSAAASRLRQTEASERPHGWSRG